MVNREATRWQTEPTMWRGKLVESFSQVGTDYCSANETVGGFNQVGTDYWRANGSVGEFSQARPDYWRMNETIS